MTDTEFNPATRARAAEWLLKYLLDNEQSSLAITQETVEREAAQAGMTKPLLLQAIRDLGIIRVEDRWEIPADFRKLLGELTPQGSRKVHVGAVEALRKAYGSDPEGLERRLRELRESRSTDEPITLTDDEEWLVRAAMGAYKEDVKGFLNEAEESSTEWAISNWSTTLKKIDAFEQRLNGEKS